MYYSFMELLVPLLGYSLNMTFTVPVVEEAANLLSKRRTEITTQIDALKRELGVVDNALAALGQTTASYGIVAGAEANQAPLLDLPRTETRNSVRAAVKAILEANDQSYIPSEVKDLIPLHVRGARTDDKLISSIRTAFWSLRQSHEAVLVENGQRTKAAKWVTDTGVDPYGYTHEDRVADGTLPIRSDEDIHDEARSVLA